MKIFIISLGVIIFAVIAFLAYMGMFSPLTVVEREIGPYKIACKDFKGPYQQTGKIFSEVDAALSNGFGIKATRGIGFYYDDPARTKPEELRSKLGSIIEQDSYSKLSDIAKRLEVVDYPATKCVAAEFPVRNLLSYMIGPMKVYPALGKYSKEKGIKCTIGIEIYDMPNKTITYALEIEKK